jgi:hypothetical protein
MRRGERLCDFAADRHSDKVDSVNIEMIEQGCGNAREILESKGLRLPSHRPPVTRKVESQSVGDRSEMIDYLIPDCGMSRQCMEEQNGRPMFSCR